jgi:MOSC domain-containing protein
VAKRGLADDRRWMVVDACDTMLTQRTVPRLALIGTRFEGGALRVSAPGMAELLLAPVPEGGEVVRVRVWGDDVDGVRAGSEASAWLSEFLGFECRLVGMPERAQRTLDPKYGAGRQVSLADAFPFLMISQASLDQLNARLRTPVRMNRFRPNLVVAGCPPHAEDSWRRIAVGGVRFRIAKPCSRCATIIVEQETGERGKEPLATLASYRQVGHDVLFGQNLVHDEEGELRVGDLVSVLE